MKNLKARVLYVIIGAAFGSALAFLAITPRLAPFVSGALASPSTEAADSYRALQLFGQVFETVRDDYVDKPDDTKLMAGAINGMLSGLDPHSSYMDAKSFQDMQVDTSGQFGGLGMEVTMDSGMIKIVSPIDGTPAAAAGIMADDVITQVDDQPTKGLPLNEIVDKLRGPAGTTVKLQIARKGETKPLDLTLTRQVITVRSVTHRDEGGDVGYIRITQFNSPATDELKKAIQDIATKIPRDRLKGYILDLRNNPGGLLDQAVSVSDAFLQQGEIVSTRGRNPEEFSRFEAKPGDLIDGAPLIVLINGGSASASEIVSGALQDHKRATILGSRSFGKASVQTIIPLGEGNGAIRLTTARYYTPSGRSLQAQGVAPDIEVLEVVPKDIQARSEDISEATLRGHLKAQGEEEKGSQSYVPPDPKDDRALQTALALLRGTQVNPAFPPNPKRADAH